MGHVWPWGSCVSCCSPVFTIKGGVHDKRHKETGEQKFKLQRQNSSTKERNEWHGGKKLIGLHLILFSSLQQWLSIGNLCQHVMRRTADRRLELQRADERGGGDGEARWRHLASLLEAETQMLENKNSPERGEQSLLISQLCTVKHSAWELRCLIGLYINITHVAY